MNRIRLVTRRHALFTLNSVHDLFITATGHGKRAAGSVVMQYSMKGISGALRVPRLEHMITVCAGLSLWDSERTGRAV